MATCKQFFSGDYPVSTEVSTIPLKFEVFAIRPPIGDKVVCRISPRPAVDWQYL